MGESGIYRTPALQGWQRTNVVAAANILREQIARTPEDPKLRAAYEGLLDLLDPSRLLARITRATSSVSASGFTPSWSESSTRHRSYCASAALCLPCAA